MNNHSKQTQIVFNFLSVASLLLSLALNNQAVAAASPQAITVDSGEEGEDIGNDVALFDDGVVHSIKIIIPDEDFQEMISIYRETGEKEYFEADVVIDGVTIEDVGLRLKGNSTLRTALGGQAGGRPGGQGAPGGPAGPEGERQERPPIPDDAADKPRPAQQQAGDDGAGVGEADDTAMPAPQGVVERPAAGVESDSSKIPLMIKFDKYIDDQTYQGYSLLAIRTGGHAGGVALLQEPVTNAMFRLVGLPATQTAFAGVQLNDETEQLYTLSEVIDENYVAQYFSHAGGILYKSEMGASLSYDGEDAADYTAAYEQKTDEDDIDMSPIIDFTRFLDEADDESFDAELDGYLDVDSFAAYLAANNLLVNLDTIAGMNNNYYLYYDNESGRFTLLMWDSNESLGGMSRDGNAAAFDLYATRQEDSDAGGPMDGKDNVLVSRFMASERFEALYEEKLQQIYRGMYASGALLEQVETYAALVQQELESRQLVDVEANEQAVQDVRDFISERSSYLASTELLRTQSGGTD